MQAKAHLKLVTPTGKKRAVAPQRRPNSEYRKREHALCTASSSTQSLTGPSPGPAASAWFRPANIVPRNSFAAAMVTTTAEARTRLDRTIEYARQ